MKILLTGASGFIGSALARKLHEEQHQLLCLVRKKSNLTELTSLEPEFIYGDLLNPDQFPVFPDDIDAVFHLAAYVDFSAVSTQAYRRMLEINVQASENLFRKIAVSNPGLKRFIFFSSLASMGFQRGRSVNNGTLPEPDTLYGKSKYLCEKALEKIAAETGIPLLILRPSLVYGTGDRRSDLLHSLRLIKKGIFPVFGKGNNIMSPVIYLADLLEICIRFLRTEHTGKLICARNEKFTINQFVETSVSRLRVKSGSIHIPVLAGKIMITPIELLAKITGKAAPLSRRRIVDLSTDRLLTYIHEDLDQAINYHPATSLGEGLDQVIPWYRKMNLI